MGGPVENCLGGGMHMQTCKHEDIKKTKKAKGKKHYMKLGLKLGLWNQSLGLLPTKLSQCTLRERPLSGRLNNCVNFT